MTLRADYSNPTKSGKRIQKSIHKIENSDYDGSSISPILERKLESVTAGLGPAFLNILNTVSYDNASTIADYILAMKTEANLSDSYRQNNIWLLCKLSSFNDNKPFKKITKRDSIITFLDSFRKIEASDPLHKWIGTYNLYRIHLLRFFKWLHYPGIEAKKRPKPEVVQNIPRLKRKEKSIYMPSDLWSAEDDLLFLKYCPSKRMRCYHTMSRDLSCRPNEILKLKIKDLQFKTVLGNNQYAEVVVNGKTGTRSIPLINSIPYVKDYLDHEHPQPSNPNAPLICGTGKSLGRKLRELSLNRIYNNFKKEIFPKLLETPDIQPEDKQKIKDLLRKPWNPYIRRHSALTEKSTILKEHVLRQHAGWSAGSQMPQKYLHYYGNESSESLLEAYGIIPKGQQIDQLKPKQCPNCSEPNKIDSKFCAKCRMVLTYDAYSETLEEQKIKENKLSIMEDNFTQMRTALEKLITVLSESKNQYQVNMMAKSLFDSGMLRMTDNTKT